MTSPPFAKFPATAAARLERAIERHGGWDAWRRLRAVESELEFLAGPLPVVKGLGRTHRVGRRARVEPARQRVTFEGHPAAGMAIRFEGGDLRVERIADGETITYSPRHRASFRGLNKLRRWTDLDAAYFFGYALLTYHSLPFLLAQTRFIAEGRRERCWAVTVEMPSGFPTHSPIQTFAFDDTGLLRRHDYVAEIIGGWARGAHYSDDYVGVSGLQWARTRRVFVALGPFATPIPVLRARLCDFRVDSD